jgi:succinate-acetate transporter protein
MSNVANEKGSINYSNNIGDEHHHGAGGNAASALPAHTYVHNTAPQLRVIGNPGPLGLFSFASTTFILSMYNVHAVGVVVPNAVIGMACFVGGLAQVLAGMWEFATGNSFGATAFTSFGGFWLAYAAILHPDFGVTAAYANAPGQLANALGIFLAAWFIFTFIMLLATLRVNLALIAVFGLLDLTFMFLMISEFTESLTIHKVGGGFGLATAAAAFYAGAAQLLTEDNSFFTLPVGPIRRRRLD